MFHSSLQGKTRSKTGFTHLEGTVLLSETPPDLGTLLVRRDGMGQRERLSGGAAGTPLGGEPPCLSRGCWGCRGCPACPGDALLPSPGAAHLVRPSQPERGGFAGRVCGERGRPPPPARTAHTHTSHGGRKGSVCLGHTDTQTYRQTHRDRHKPPRCSRALPVAAGMGNITCVPQAPGGFRGSFRRKPSLKKE